MRNQGLPGCWEAWRARPAHLLSCEYKEVVNLVVSSSFPSSSFLFSSNFNLEKNKEINFQMIT